MIYIQWVCELCQSGHQGNVIFLLSRSSFTSQVTAFSLFNYILYTLLARLLPCLALQVEVFLVVVDLGYCFDQLYLLISPSLVVWKSYYSLTKGDKQLYTCHANTLYIYTHAFPRSEWSVLQWPGDCLTVWCLSEWRVTAFYCGCVTDERIFGGCFNT